ncbi:MAG: metal-dependent hydrolase [Thermovenabulum sp.]|uniref:metal-dependent hydrolase n=1 Tax=Thermovenabulum sp. TaxID=3100335 RepID=UPI003C7B656D
MTGSTHILIGALSGVILTSKMNITGVSAASLTAISAISALIPDIDMPGSKIGRKAKPASFILNKTVGHRGIMHSLLGAIITAFIVKMYLSLQHFNYIIPGLNEAKITAGLLIGYLSHLLGDMMTKEGIPLLYPLIRRKISIVGIKSGGIAEQIFSIILIIIIFKMMI